MFISYEYFGEYRNTWWKFWQGKKYRYEYKIIDTDFEEVGVGVAVGVDAELAQGTRAVVKTYRKRNLPVAPNLILYWQYHSRKHGFRMEQLMKWVKKYSPFYTEYEDEINKYLLLL